MKWERDTMLALEMLRKKSEPTRLVKHIVVPSKEDQVLEEARDVRLMSMLSAPKLENKNG